jgi:hypothetical protein
MTVGDPFNLIVYAFAMPKLSPYLDEISNHILQLKERGFMEERMRIW